MQIEAVTMGGVERAHGAINAAYNALATDGEQTRVPQDARLARDYVEEACTELRPAGGHDGADAATAAARAVLPRLERALQLLEELMVAPDTAHVAPLLDELGIAMDHVEQALAAVGHD
jgi:hypothetical protein